MWSGTRRAPGTGRAVPRAEASSVGSQARPPRPLGPQLIAFDRVEVPRWLAWGRLSRGAQLILTRVCAQEARGVQLRRCKRCDCSSCKHRKRQKGGQGAVPRWSLIKRVRRGVGRVRRPLRWFADVAGVLSERQASNIVRELESVCPTLVRRHHGYTRNPDGTVDGTILSLDVNLDAWIAGLVSGDAVRAPSTPSPQGAPLERVPPAPDCPACGGLGWRDVERPGGQKAMARCGCTRPAPATERKQISGISPPTLPGGGVVGSRVEGPGREGGPDPGHPASGARAPT
jgi:hypothetical protein